MTGYGPGRSRPCARSPRLPGNRGWADPDVRLGLGLAVLLLAGLPVHDHSIGTRETRLFRAVNQLPQDLYPPAWILMQSGNLVAVPTAATLAVLAGRPRLAAQLGLAGTATWALSKLVKRVYRRPRPPALVQGARSRGPEPSGLGYVSGHAGVALALGTAAWPYVNTAGRLAIAAVVPAVGLSRVYVGAHLPLDVVGGTALGLATEAICERLMSQQKMISQAWRTAADSLTAA